MSATATTDSIRALQEVVQDLSEKGLVKEEAFRQISEATKSAFNASQEANPFINPRLMKDDFHDISITGVGDYLRHMPTGRIFVQDPDDGELVLKGIILNEDHLPLSARSDDFSGFLGKGRICWATGQDPEMEKIRDVVKRLEESDKETKEQIEIMRGHTESMKLKLKAAREGSLLAFQEVEIKDLEEERDRYKKLNEGLLKKLKEQKEDYEKGKRRWAQCQNDITEDLFIAWEGMRENEIPIPTTTEETAKFCRWVADQNEELPDCFQPVPFVWSGDEYLLIERTNETLDIEDGEVLGKRYMCGNCGEVHVKWNYESDSDDEGPDSP